MNLGASPLWTGMWSGLGAAGAIVLGLGGSPLGTHASVLALATVSTVGC